MDSSHHKKQFCLLLTGTIVPHKSASIKRGDPSLRIRDYTQSIMYWLEKTDLPIVFCENSGYNLESIRHLSKKYPERIEILQFTLTEYTQGFDYGYGEYKIIEYAMNHSLLLANTKKIIKVTGRVFIENIEDILKTVHTNSVVAYTKHIRKDTPQKIHTILFLFDKEFYSYLKKNKHLLGNMNFEDFFEKCLKEAHKDGYVIQKLSIVPQYRGRSGYKNIPYDQIFAMKKGERILYYIKDILRTLINISKMIFGK